MSVVVSDTSPLHYLVECEAIEILPALFQEILIPPTVHRELQHQKTPPRVRAWAQSLPAWVKVQAPAVLDDSLNVDEGEKEAICLAREVKAVAILRPSTRAPTFTPTPKPPPRPSPASKPWWNNLACAS